MISAVRCSCGWELFVEEADGWPLACVFIGRRVPVMIDHWKRGHQLRAHQGFRNVIAFSARMIKKGNPLA